MVSGLGTEICRIHGVVGDAVVLANCHAYPQLLKAAVDYVRMVSSTTHPHIKGAPRRGVRAVAPHVLAVGDPVVAIAAEPRSEERRVGKECRSRWSPYH